VGERFNAFTTIGPALVHRNFHQHPPFYGTVIAPHAVAAKGRIFCAFQDTKGRSAVNFLPRAQASPRRNWYCPSHPFLCVFAAACKKRLR